MVGVPGRAIAFLAKSYFRLSPLSGPYLQCDRMTDLKPQVAFGPTKFSPPSCVILRTHETYIPRQPDDRLQCVLAAQPGGRQPRTRKVV